MRFNNYQSTIRACFTGYIVQAIVNTFIPLLFVTFQVQYGIPLSKITMLITFNFALQLVIDFASAFFIDKIGYRAAAVIAHAFAAAGLMMLAILPDILPDPFAGIITAVAVYAVGGGLLEVVVSPIVEACPSEHKDKTMSMLHSFYCWGCVGVVGVSTLLFKLFGIENWRYIALLWTLIPIANGIFFTKVPIASLVAEDEEGLSFAMLIKNKLFWFFAVIICCAGASEQAVSQWASAFAEKGLGISKTAGDLAGPMAFSVMMGLSRVMYGKFGEKINLEGFMIFSTALCAAAYLSIALVPYPIVGLIGCAVCGMSVGILWPGTYSCAAAGIKGGGTAMFALLALAGDLGCAGGPTLAGLVSDRLDGNLHMGILAAVIFPIVLLAGMTFRKIVNRK